MGFIDTVKDLFTRTEVTEETFEYESIDSYLAKQAAREAAREALEGAEEKDDVALKCDQIIDATYHLDELKAEYDMVTSYFTDIQTIEELQPSIRQEITTIAKRIAALESETSAFLHSDDRISDANFRMISGIEKDLNDIFAQLKELEDMDAKQRKIRRNMFRRR